MMRERNFWIIVNGEIILFFLFIALISIPEGWGQSSDTYSLLGTGEIRLALKKDQVTKMKESLKLHFKKASSERPEQSDLQIVSVHPSKNRAKEKSTKAPSPFVLEFIDNYHGLGRKDQDGEFDEEEDEETEFIDLFTEIIRDTDQEDSDGYLIMDFNTENPRLKVTKQPILEESEEEVFQKQLKNTLDEAAYRICIQEIVKTGVELVDFHDYKYEYDEENEEYYFTELTCSTLSDRASHLRGGNSLALDIIKMHPQLYMRGVSANQVSSDEHDVCTVSRTDVDFNKKPKSTIDERTPSTSTESAPLFSLKSIGLDNYLPWAVDNMNALVGGVNKICTKGLPQFAKAFGKGTQIAVCSFAEDLAGRDPFDGRTYNPFSYLPNIAKKVITATTVDMVEQNLQKKDDDKENLSAVPELAAQMLIKYKHTITDEQSSLMGEWIKEANEKLKGFVDKRQKELETIMESKEPTDKSADGASADTGKSSQLNLKNIEKRVQLAAQAKRPSRALLEKEDPELLKLLLALQAVTQLPYEIQKQKPEDVRRRAESSLYMGGQGFRKDLMDLAGTVADDSGKGLTEQTKRVNVASSGPGTGKTTNIRRMAKKWANVPICTLSGETVNRMKVPAGRTIFDEISTWIQSCLKRQFKVKIKRKDKDGNTITNKSGKPKYLYKKVMNGFILFDDFHMTLDPNGQLGKDPDSRQKFFELLKAMADANQEDSFKIELMDGDKPTGRFFPLNLGRIQPIITLNKKIPQELIGDSSSADGGALASRRVDLNADYPNEEDRKIIASSFLKLLKKRIYKLFAPQLKKQDQESSQDHGQDQDKDKSVKGKVEKAVDDDKEENDGDDAAEEENEEDGDKDNEESDDEEDDNDKVKDESLQIGINFQECADRLEEIVNADIKIMSGSGFNRQLGIRGLAILLKKYYQHVSGKLALVKSVDQLDSKICSFAGEPKYDLDKIIVAIGDYSKQLDQNMSQAEDERLLAVFIQEIEKRIEEGQFTETENTAIVAALKLAKSDKSFGPKSRKLAAAQADQLITNARNKVEIPDAEELGRRLDRQFGYLAPSLASQQSTQAINGVQVKKSKAIDRYRPIKRVVEDIHVRLLAIRNSVKKELIPDNKLIRVGYTHPAAQDPTLFEQFGKMLGGLPTYMAVRPYEIFPSPAAVEELSSLDTPGARSLIEIGDSRYFFRINFKGQRTKVTLRVMTLTKQNNEKILAVFFLPEGSDGDMWIVYPKDYTTLKRIAEAGGENFLDDQYIHHLSNPKHLELNTQGLQNFFRESLKTDIGLWSSSYKQLKDKLSANEGFISIILNADVEDSLAKWAATVSKDVTLKPIDVLENYLYTFLNGPQIQLEDGMSLDPRQLTIFLVKPQESVWGKPSEKSIDLVLGPPPVEGRKNKAKAILEGELELLHEKLKVQALIAKKDASLVQKPVLNSAEEEIFQKLIDWDFEKAKRAADADYILPLSPLVSSVSDLAMQVRERYLDYFKQGTTLQPLNSFEASWEEFYSQQTNEVEAIHKMKEKEREFAEAFKRQQSVVPRVVPVPVESDGVLPVKRNKFRPKEKVKVPTEQPHQAPPVVKAEVEADDSDDEQEQVKSPAEEAEED